MPFPLPSLRCLPSPPPHLREALTASSLGLFTGEAPAGLSLPSEKRLGLVLGLIIHVWIMYFIRNTLAVNLCDPAEVHYKSITAGCVGW